MTLFLLGFITLFLELALIRFLAGNIWNLGYFPNFVLISVFMGMALGFIGHRWVPEKKSPIAMAWGSFVLLALVAFVTLAHPMVPGFANAAGNVGGELYFSSVPEQGIGKSVLAFLSCFLGVMSLFALIAQYTAKFFVSMAPLKAYSLDILGSCCGILLFILISWLRIPAFVWLLVLYPLFLIVAGRSFLSKTLISLTMLGSVYLAWNVDQKLLANPESPERMTVAWSPYQKVEHVSDAKQWQYLFVNGIGHQTMLPETDHRKWFYQSPFQDRKARADLPPYRSVLVLGAGSGNDVAAALQNGAEHVDAVEIDPVIAHFGRKHHPLRPYDDPRVQLTIDDGRAFMNRTERRYDLIIFALTDSLVKVSPVSQLRLENYLFTEESVRKAFELLNPNGDLLFYNYYRRLWLLEKIQVLIHQATGRVARMIHEDRDFKMLSVENSVSSAPPPRVSTMQAIPTDNWPFLYLQERAIPAIYWFSMLGMAGFVALVAVLLRVTQRKFAGVKSSASPSLRFAFLLMGIAFLLLETKSVIQFSLLFGTTWLNSSLVFLAILLLILAANWIALKISSGTAPMWLFVLLVLSSLAPLVFPLGNLLSLQSVTLRFALASLMTFSPIFFANVLFSVSFRDQKIPDQLFGWNMLGATLGGVAEYSSMALGYNNLAILVAVCYAGAFFLLRRAPLHSAAIPIESSPLNIQR